MAIAEQSFHWILSCLEQSVTAHAISERLIAELPKLPPQLAVGARFLVDNPEAIALSSMREIAGKVGVAPGTMLRLARSIGFKDWSRFREACLDHFQLSQPHYAERADALIHRAGVPGMIEEVMRAQRAALDHVASVNDIDTIDEAAKLLNRAPRIFVAAFMSCRSPALAFTYICSLFRSSVILVGEGGSTVSDLADLRSDDAVLAINFLPYAREIHLVAEAVSRSNATLISIADSRATPLAPFAKSILLYSAQSPSFFPSISASLAVVEVLAAGMLAHAGEAAVHRVDLVEKSLYNSGSYDILDLAR